MPDPSVDPDPHHMDLAERWAALPGNVRGGILFITAAAIFSVMISLIKLAGQRLHVTEILFFRQLVMVSIALPAIISGWPGSMQSARPRLQLLRVGLAFTAMTLGFAAVIELPLAEATVISFSRTFFTTVLAIVILSEVVRLPRWTGLLFGFSGVLIVIWPDQTSSFNHWHLMALGSAVCVAVVSIVIRILAQLDQPVTILTYQALGVGLLMFGPMLWFWKTPTLFEAGILVAIGALSAVAQYLNILAFKAGEASALAPLEYSRLLFTTVLGLWLFAEWPEPRVWLGAAIIVMAALYVMHRERQAAKRL